MGSDHDKQSLYRHLMAAIFAWVFFVGAPGAAAAEMAATVERVIGDVYVERDGTREPLQVGAVLGVTDLIVTAKGAKVHIVFADGSSVVAGPDTRFAIAHYDPADRRGGVLELLTGIIRTGLSTVWNTGFSIETRAAVASVRSTHWITIADADQSSVFVLTGVVAVRATATDEVALLESGDGIDVPIGGGLGPVKQWPMERVGLTMAPTLLP